MTTHKKQNFGQGGFGADYKPHPTPLAMHFPIMIDGEILETEFYREEFDTILQAQEGDLITVMLSSGGGNLSTSLRFYSLLKESPAHTVAIVESHAHSGASIIAMGCDEIRATPYAEMLIHTCGYHFGGSHPDVKAYVKHSDRMMEKIVPEVYAGFLSEGRIADVLRGEQVWLFAEDVQEAIKAREAYLVHQHDLNVKAQEAAMEEAFNEQFPEPSEADLKKLNKAQLIKLLTGEADLDETGSYVEIKE